MQTLPPNQQPDSPTFPESLRQLILANRHTRRELHARFQQCADAFFWAMQLLETHEKRPEWRGKILKALWQGSQRTGSH